MTTTVTKISSFVLLTQYLVCGSFVPSAGLLGNYVGGLSGGSALEHLQARDFSSDTSSGEEYAYEGGHEYPEKHLDDEQFDGKHDLTEEIHDTKDHSDFSSEHEHEAEHENHHESAAEPHHHESEAEYNHHDDIIPEQHYAHDDEKSSDYEPNESKMFHHPALDFDSSEFVKKIYHGKGGFSYSTLYTSS